MVVVDTHCHVSPYWYEPVETLLYQMTTNGVDKAVLIQMGQVRIYDNAYLVELSLSRLSHWLPRGQAHPEVVQGTAQFHHEIADALLP